MNYTDKQLVRKCFNKNFETYHQKAIVQQEIAIELADLLVELGITSIGNVLEVGCGTGFLTHQIISKIKVSNYFLNDLADVAYKENRAFLNAKKTNSFIKIPGDAEVINFPEGLDGVVSSSTIQWFNQLDAFFLKVHASLNSDGFFAFSTFGTANFKEIKAVSNVGLNYTSLSEIKKMLGPNFEVLVAKEWELTTRFSNPIEVLRHMKLTGVTGVSKSFFGKEKIQAFIKKYQGCFSNDDCSVNLTYNPMIIIAKKK